MRAKLKSHKKAVILIVGIVLLVGVLFLMNYSLDKKSSYLDNKNMNTKIEDNNVDGNVDNQSDISNNELDKNVEDEGEKSIVVEEKIQTDNTPKTNVNNKSNSNSVSNSNETKSSQETKKEQDTTNKSNNDKTTSNSNEVESNKSSESNNNETTNFYDSITHGQWENDADSESLCLAKGLKIQEKELDEILDWNEIHQEDQRQPIINYSRCYPVIKNGQKHWYLHFFTTLGEEKDQELKQKYD